MWNVTSNVIPAIIRATGTTSKSLRQYLSNISGKRKIKEIKKQPYWALHTYYGSTNVKVQNNFTGEITLHVAQIVTTEEVQHYMP